MESISLAASTFDGASTSRAATGVQKRPQAKKLPRIPRSHNGSLLRMSAAVRLPRCSISFSRSSGVPSKQSLHCQHGLRSLKSVDEVGRLYSHGEGFDFAVLSSGCVFNPVSCPGCRTSRYSRPVVKAVFERFTERAIKSVMLAQREAKAFRKTEVGTEQLLLGLIAEDRASEGFLRSGITIERAREAARAVSGDNVPPTSPDKPATEVPFSVGSKRVFEAALENSKKMGHNYIAPEHIALALFTVDEGPATEILERLGLKKEKLQTEAISRLQGELDKEGRTPMASLAVPAKSTAAAGTVSKRSSGRKEKGALADFCVDITARAREGRIDPVIGRDKEVQRVVQILARRTKNNPILLGEPGVGKTAIAEGLALRIVGSNVPEFLNGKRVMSLDMGLLLAGAKERGELESRVTSLIDEIRKAGNVVLLIDEVHMLVGSGTVGRGGISGAGLDIANLLKPALARGELQCIGATTIGEHRKYIEKDKALARRFQPVIVNEPSQEDAVEILLGLRDKYEEHHKCRITTAAVEAAVYLSARYIADRFLPDKAIDLLDEAGSRARINAFKRRKEQEVGILSKSPSEYWQKIRTVQAFQEAVLVPQIVTDSSLASGASASAVQDTVLRSPDIKDDSSLSISSVFGRDSTDDGPVVVDAADIASVASMWSGIPIEQLTADEQSKLLHIEETLRSRVVGQDDAVSAIARAVKRARVGLKDPNRPIAAMLFCGPTGVGKTELTKALAQHYFGSEQAMIRLDMSEYMERHAVSKLTGPPPGYVGYGDGGVLTESVRKRPFTIVLLDEIEKAHPDVFNILLQVFEDGHLTDSQGRRVSFKNTLLVMTSNIGSSLIAKGGSNRIGFTFTDDVDGGKYAALKALVTDELKSYFRPELLNRLDEVVVFRSLEKSDVREIVEMMLKETSGRLSKLGIGLEISEAMIKLICDQGYDPTYGARPLRRAIVHLIEDKVSEALLGEAYIAGDTALVDIDEAGNPVVTHYNKPDKCHHGLCLSIRTDAL